MRRPRYLDFDCAACGTAIELFVETNDDSLPLEPQPCACGATLAPREIAGVGYVQTVVRGNADFAEREKARLTARSVDHWKRAGRSEAIDRERAQERKMGL